MSMCVFAMEIFAIAVSLFLAGTDALRDRSVAARKRHADTNMADLVPRLPWISGWQQMPGASADIPKLFVANTSLGARARRLHMQMDPKIPEDWTADMSWPARLGQGWRTGVRVSGVAGKRALRKATGRNDDLARPAISRDRDGKRIGGRTPPRLGQLVEQEWVRMRQLLLEYATDGNIWRVVVFKGILDPTTVYIGNVPILKALQAGNYWWTKTVAVDVSTGSDYDEQQLVALMDIDNLRQPLSLSSPHRALNPRFVDAVAAISKGQITDDSDGTLGEILMAHFGRAEDEVVGMSPSSTFDSFVGAVRRALPSSSASVPVPILSISGLAEAMEGNAIGGSRSRDKPDLSLSAARLLLARIVDVAQSERRLVVVRPYNDSSGMDCTAYFMRLGFEKVKVGGRYELVYNFSYHDARPLSYRSSSGYENDNEVVVMVAAIVPRPHDPRKRTPKAVEADWSRTFVSDSW